MPPKPRRKQNTTSRNELSPRKRGKRRSRPSKKILEAAAAATHQVARRRGHPPKPSNVQQQTSRQPQADVRVEDDPNASIPVQDLVPMDFVSEATSKHNRKHDVPRTDPFGLQVGSQSSAKGDDLVEMFGQGPAFDNVDNDEMDFTVEPTDDIFVQTLTEGIASGTIPLSDSDSEILGDDGKEVNAWSAVYSLKIVEETGNILPPVTSTPFMHKSVRARARDTIGVQKVKVNIHDGLAMRFENISSRESYLEVLEKAAKAMKRPNNIVEIGYEAPWSSRIGTKKCLAYISCEGELDNFWLAYDQYVKNQRAKKRNRSEELMCEIVFRNMLDNAPNATKVTSRPSDSSRGGRPLKIDDPTFAARGSANVKIIQATQLIQHGMFCRKHNRLCYGKFDGSCGVYTPDLVLEHAEKLARGEPHVLADKVPASMSSKVLDYERPGKKLRKASPGIQTNMNVAPMPLERETEPRVNYRGPLDYPAIATWLRACEEDFERGRDKHEYTVLLPMFAVNGCTRIDDIARMTPETIKSVAEAQGTVVTIGLVNRVHEYAVEDVARVKRDGKLVR